MQQRILIGIITQVGKTMLIFRPALKNECRSEENYSWSAKPAITSNGEHCLFSLSWLSLTPLSISLLYDSLFLTLTLYLSLLLLCTLSHNLTSYPLSPPLSILLPSLFLSSLALSLSSISLYLLFVFPLSLYHTPPLFSPHSLSFSSRTLPHSSLAYLTLSHSFLSLSSLSHTLSFPLSLTHSPSFSHSLFISPLTPSFLSLSPSPLSHTHSLFSLLSLSLSLSASASMLVTFMS